MKKTKSLSKPLCEDCGNLIIPFEEGYKKCKDCFFKSKTCEDCGKQIIPYKEGYTKCRTCFYKPYQKIKESSNIQVYRNYSTVNLGKVLLIIIFVMFLAGFISPLMLSWVHSDMKYVIGNPKPLYFYDINSDCDSYRPSIISSLNYLSKETNVKFVRLPPPLSLLVGGISYNCGKIMSTPGAVGESEAGFFQVSFFIVAWNKISLLYSDEHTILHETLHSMGFDHSSNLENIMYPYDTGQSLDKNTIGFIQKFYVNNPLAYLNIIPLNLFYISLFLFFLIAGVIGAIISGIISFITGLKGRFK